MNTIEQIMDRISKTNDVVNEISTSLSNFSEFEKNFDDAVQGIQLKSHQVKHVKATDKARALQMHRLSAVLAQHITFLTQLNTVLQQKLTDHNIHLSN